MFLCMWIFFVHTCASFTSHSIKWVVLASGLSCQFVCERCQNLRNCQKLLLFSWFFWGGFLLFFWLLLFKFSSFLSWPAGVAAFLVPTWNLKSVMNYRHGGLISDTVQFSSPKNAPLNYSVFNLFFFKHFPPKQIVLKNESAKGNKPCSSPKAESQSWWH